MALSLTPCPTTAAQSSTVTNEQLEAWLYHLPLHERVSIMRAQEQANTVDMKRERKFKGERLCSVCGRKRLRNDNESGLCRSCHDRRLSAEK